jgi:drug/metabolite transporter (DMT)-like permease
MTAQAAPDFDELRSKVRAMQHARSTPLLVMGALLVNYGVSNFAPSPVAWRYAAPLAFVLIWAFGKLNESRVGVGPGRADYLVAAGFVFIASNLLLSLKRFTAGGSTYYFQLTGAWVVIVGVALATVAWSTRDRVLMLAGAAVTVCGAALFAVHPSNDFNPGFGFLGMERTWQMTLVVVLGAVLGVAGLLLYRRERVEA